MTEEQPWRNLSEAAALTGLDREAIRSRTRRGQWPSRKNNRGELMVQIPPDLPTGPDRSADQLMTALVNDLVAEIGDLRAMLERAKAGRETAEAIRVAERDTAEAVRRPWWHRLIAG